MENGFSEGFRLDFDNRGFWVSVIVENKSLINPKILNCEMSNFSNLSFRHFLSDFRI